MNTYCTKFGNFIRQLWNEKENNPEWDWMAWLGSVWTNTKPTCQATPRRFCALVTRKSTARSTTWDLPSPLDFMVDPLRQKRLAKTLEDGRFAWQSSADIRVPLQREPPGKGWIAMEHRQLQCMKLFAKGLFHTACETIGSWNRWSWDWSMAMALVALVLSQVFRAHRVNGAGNHATHCWRTCDTGKFTCRERWRDASQFRLTVTMSLRRCKGEYLLVELQSWIGVNAWSPLYIIYY